MTMDVDNWANKYRPQTTKQMVGQATATALVDKMLADRRIARTILISGETGHGKTTLARIIAEAVNDGRPWKNNTDVVDINAGAEGGIDKIRSIADAAANMPQFGNYRVFMIDECFASGTLVITQNGAKKIQDVEVGDTVANAIGYGLVTSVFANKIPLDRLARLDFNDGRTTFTTVDHLYWSDGWVAAKNMEGKTDYGAVRAMQKTVRFQENGARYVQILQQVMRRSLSSTQTRRACQNLHAGVGAKNIGGAETISCVGVGGVHHQKRAVVGQYAVAEWATGGSGKSSGHELRERELRPVRRIASRRERENNDPAAAPVGRVQDCGRGISYLYSGGRISDVLPSGCRVSRIEIGGRSGWQVTSVPQTEGIGFQERPEAVRTRVDRVTVYERGNNDKLFEGVVGDQERAQGFAVFYDLEVDGHPSYFANGSLVHNCHKLTGAARNAALKLTEEPPGRSMFLLLTNYPDELPRELLGRCLHIRLKAVEPKALMPYLAWIGKQENAFQPPNANAAIYRWCAESAGGQPRQAVQLFQMCAMLEGRADLNTIMSEVVATYGEAPEKSAAQLLCGLYGFSPKIVVQAMQGVQDPPAVIRQALYVNQALIEKMTDCAKWAPIGLKKLEEWLARNRKDEISINYVFAVHGCLAKLLDHAGYSTAAKNATIIAALGAIMEAYRNKDESVPF